MNPVQSIAQPLTLHMHGEMKEKFGGPYKLHVHSAAEAFRLMEANFHQKFYRYLHDGSFHVVRGETLDEGHSLPPGTSDGTVMKWLQIGARDIHIVPVLAGASSTATKGTFATIAGALLIAASIALAIPTGGASLAAGFATAVPGTAGFLTAGTIGSLGIALAAGGIISLLAKAQQTDTGHIVGGLFGAPTNTAAQGVPVPVIYGRVRRAGSVAIDSYTALKKVDLQ